MPLKYIYLSILLPVIGWQASPGQSIRFEVRAAAAGVVIDGGGHGVAVADYDGDGRDDVFLAAADGHSTLFRNLGDAVFEDVTAAAGVAVPGYAVQPLWGDIDNDGDLDLFVGVRSEVDSSRLFLNEDGVFSDVSRMSGIDLAASVGTAAFGDYDGDGWLDLFVATRDSEDRLYRNAGGVFEDVTTAAGVAGLASTIAMQATWNDYDRDGDLDLFAVHDGNQTSRLYRQRSTPPPFVEAGATARLQVARSAMGVAWGDYDNDGWPDVYVTNIDQGNLFHNNGDGTFTDVTEASGAGRNGMSWGAVFADFDNDGDEDLFIGNTFDFDGRRSFLYENRGGQFVDVAESAGAALSTNTFGVAAGDFDDDGRVDLFVTDDSGQNKVLLNRSVDPGTYVVIRPEGTEGDASGIGVRVLVSAAGVSYERIVDGGSSFCSQSSPRMHFGLARAGRIDTLEVDWGGGNVHRYFDLGVNRMHVVREDGSILVHTESPEPLVADRIDLVNYPNPFTRSTTIELRLPRDQHASVRVYDVTGRQVGLLVDGYLPAGRHRLQWNAGPRPAGVYFARVETEGRVYTNTLTLIR